MLVTHRLDEIISLTDRIAVMQDGEVILEQPTAEATEASLVAAIAGGDPGLRPPATEPARQEQGAEPVPRVRGLRLEPRVKDIGFDLYLGEILGLAGLVGSGRTEVARMIFGAERPQEGTIEIAGRTRRPAACRRGARGHRPAARGPSSRGPDPRLLGAGQPDARLVVETPPGAPAAAEQGE